MSFLLRNFTLRHLWREWVRTGLAVAGVALGVAVFLAIRIANASVLGAFASTVDAIAGKANLEVSAWAPGMDERLFLRILGVRGVMAAAPQVQGVAPLYSAAVAPEGNGRPAGRRFSTETPEGGSVLILGMDPFRQADFNSTVSSSLFQDSGSPAFLLDPLAVHVSSSLADAHHLRVGSTLPVLVGVRRVDLHVDGILPRDPLARAYGGNVAVMDIAAAQELFGRVGKLDGVTLRVEKADIPRVQAELQRILPPSVKVQRPSSRTATVERMLGAFELNLEALSLIALFVGVFLIYNTLSAAVVRRRGELGILRSLGVSSAGVSGLVILEAAIIGVLGASLGLLLGYWISAGLLHSVAQTVSALYVQVEANQIHAPRSLMVGVWLLGVAAATVAAIIPALEAAGIEPAEVVRQGAQVRISHMRWTLFGVLGPSLLALALGLSVLSQRARLPWLSFAAAFLILLGFSLLAPVACRLLITGLSRVTEHLPGLPLRIGTAFLLASLERVWIVVAALGAAISMLVGLSIMIGSFRMTVGQWVAQTAVADVFVLPASGPVSGSGSILPAVVVQKAARIPGVAAVDPYRYVPFNFRDGESTMVARLASVMMDHAAYHVRQGTIQDAVRKMAAENGALISGPFSEKYNLHEGDAFLLPTPSGPVRFQVVGVFEDYTSDQGTVVIALERYRTLWHDPTVNSVALFAKQGVASTVLAARVGSAFPTISLIIRTNAELRQVILKVFDQTFRVTYALETVAVLVALMGIASTLITLVMQRLRQLATLRALGASRSQVVLSIMVEAAMIAVIAWALGSISGVALAAELIYVVLPGFFHWTVQLSWPLPTFAWSLALVLPSSLAAAVLPALAASRVEISRALRTE